MRVALNHWTQYTYDRRVFLSPQLIRLRPAAHSRLTLESYTLTVQPENHAIHWQQDAFGNFVARIDFADALQKMTIQVHLIAQFQPVNPFDFLLDPEALGFPFAYDAQLTKDLAAYLELTEPGPLLTQWLRQVNRSGRGTVDFLIDLNQQLYQDIAYSERLAPGVQSAEETLQRAVGSCRDSAWLLVQLLRHLGLAARFVSGYLVQLADDQSLSQMPSTSPVDSLALHAWAEVFIPGAGWIGLDPTSGMLATESHIPLACSTQPSGAAPVSGTSGLSETSLTYKGSLVRLS
ncbi:transglutaminase N-terminal domain-containing protein [Larkinella bovis]|uniref:Transglutaminase N-terminal domain-containing protein n=1 Tax=Larkinella bovis TaxID=683041 RepID=A0ABW0IB89_9BACT